MTALGEVGTRTEVTPVSGVKWLQVFLNDATADNGDTLTVDLTQYGCKHIHGILGFRETTAGSVMVAEQPTTSVTAGVLTITIGGSTANKVRSFQVWAY